MDRAPHYNHRTRPRPRPRPILNVIAIICTSFALTSCTSLTVDMPISRDPFAPVAHIVSRKLFFDSAVTFAVPDGPQIAYTSKVNDALAIGIISQIGPLVARLTDLANSQAATAAAAAMRPALPLPTSPSTLRK